jgi:hypothetical protein
LLITYFTTYAAVTSESVTESALRAALYSRNPLTESGKQHLPAYPLYGAPQYPQVSDNNSPYNQYQHPPNPYHEYPNGGYYYPPNGYQNGVGGYPQNALNRYPNYPSYGNQLPNGYPYGTGYQYPNVYYPYQYGK